MNHHIGMPIRTIVLILFLLTLLLTGASCAGKKEQDAGAQTGASQTESVPPTNETSEESESTPEPIDEALLDPFDFLDYENAQTIEGDLYQNGVHSNPDKELVFSLKSYDLMWLLWGADENESFKARLLFTVPATDDTPAYTFPSIEVEPVINGWDSVDFLLSGESGTNFCPTAAQKYTVELAIVSSAQPEAVLRCGTYTLTTSKMISKNAYYQPTEQSGPSRIRCYTLRFAAGEHGKVEGATQQHIAPGYRSEKVTATPDAGYEFICWSDGVKTRERSGDMPQKSLKITAFFAMPKIDGVASVYLFTETGAPITKKEYEPGAMAIVGAKTESDNICTALEVKGRGNSSFNGTSYMNWYESKNSYSLKLAEKEKLLGLGTGKSRKWVLNANKYDATGLRNYFAWTIARRMGTIPYVPECTWVRLYLNGEYRGLYMLSEKVNVENGRVEVNDDPTGDPDKGYLLHLNFRGNMERSANSFYITGYGPDSRRYIDDAVEFVIKSDIEGKKDIEFIKDYVQRCHDAMMSGDRAAIDALVDIPSLIDMYILEELTKDCDAGRASFYLSKDAGGKLYFTAPWDFDFCFGDYYVSEDPEGFVSADGDCCNWFESLRSREWFDKAVHDRMAELTDDLEESIRDLYAAGNAFRVGIDENCEFWNLYGNDYHDYVLPQASGELNNLDEHMKFIEDWTRERWQWMLEN